MSLEDEAKRNLLSRFQTPEIERAYARFYELHHGTRRSVALFLGLILGATGVTALYMGLRDMCRPCADLIVTVCLGAVFAATALQLALRFVTRNPLPIVSEVAVVLWGALIGAATLAMGSLCGGGGDIAASSAASSFSSFSLSSAAEQLKDFQYLAPPIFLGIINTLCIFSFLNFSHVPWPRSVVSAGLSWLINFACYIAVYKAYPTVIGSMIIFIGGSAYVFFSAAMTNIERRSDFAMMLKLERELGATTAQNEATKSIVHALFPTDIAERLVDARYTRSLKVPSKWLVSAPLASTMTATTGSRTASLAEVELRTLPPPEVITQQPGGAGTSTTGSVGEIIVDTFASASVVCVSFDGLENIKPADAQLDVLSKLFIAAERVGATHGAVKVKSVGMDLLFVCGTVKSDGAHTENACKLVIDLQRMLAGFQKERSISCISLRGSVVTGPVAAGVIGIARPKYDVWGFTVSVAEKLCQVAGQRRLLVTRDVAKAEQSHFKFQAVRQLAIVQGIGKILPFLLVPAPNLKPIFPNCAPAEFSLPKPKVLSLKDVAKTMRKQRRPKMNPVTLQFPDNAAEASFLPVHIAKFLPHLRWLSLLIIVMFLYLYVLSILGDYCPLERHILSNIVNVCLPLVFILTWTPLRKKPKAFLWIVAVILLFFVIDMTLLLDLGVLHDPTASGLFGTVLIVSGTKIPFRISLFYGIGQYLAAFFVMLFVIGYKLDSLIGAAAWTVIALAGQRDWEASVRGNFILNMALVHNEEKTRKEKEAAQGLLESVVPLQVLQKMESVDLHAQASFFSEFIPASTTLTCTVVGFDALYRQMEPVEIVKLLNALFSHFDTLAQARGVVPLKTIADEYVVVGNMLREMEEDHAERVVGLGLDMVGTLTKFNTTLNPTHFPVSLRIGIHSSAVLSGVIRTRSFVFDCWGSGVPVAEQIMFAAAPNVVLVSSYTMELLGETFSSLPLGNLRLEGATGSVGSSVQVFGIAGEVAEQDEAVDVVSCDKEAPAASETPQPPPFEAVDYGVYLGADFTASPSSHPQATSSSAATAAATTPPPPAAVVLDPQFVPVDDNEGGGGTSAGGLMPPAQPIEAEDPGLHFVPVDNA